MYCRKRWRRILHLANEFWSRWKQDFLQSLQARRKWTRPHRNVATGDVVLIQDVQLPRNQWVLGRVEEVFPSEDGHV